MLTVSEKNTPDPAHNLQLDVLSIDRNKQSLVKVW